MYVTERLFYYLKFVYIEDMSALFKKKGSGCCVAVGCSMRKGTNLLSKVQLFTFPKNPERRLRWERAVRRENWHATSNSQLCNLHFVTGK